MKVALTQDTFGHLNVVRDYTDSSDRIKVWEGEADEEIARKCLRSIGDHVFIIDLESKKTEEFYLFQAKFTPPPVRVLKVD